MSLNYGHPGPWLTQGQLQPACPSDCTHRDRRARVALRAHQKGPQGPPRGKAESHHFPETPRWCQHSLWVLLSDFLCPETSFPRVNLLVYQGLGKNVRHFLEFPSKSSKQSPVPTFSVENRRPLRGPHLPGTNLQVPGGLLLGSRTSWCRHSSRWRAI